MRVVSVLKKDKGKNEEVELVVTKYGVILPIPKQNQDNTSQEKSRPSHKQDPHHQ